MVFRAKYDKKKSIFSAEKWSVSEPTEPKDCFLKIIWYHVNRKKYCKKAVYGNVVGFWNVVSSFVKEKIYQG